MRRVTTKLSIGVLVYPDWADSYWTAVAVYLDLVEAQASFALQQCRPGMMFRRAPGNWQPSDLEVMPIPIPGGEDVETSVPIYSEAPMQGLSAESWG